MKIIKAGKAQAGGETTAEMEAINALAKTELREDEVYIFSVLLCDNEIDRDFERFPEQTLKELEELFIGTTGISDHDWKSAGQKARIYRTELVKEPGRMCLDAVPYIYLKGYAYMLRTESNRETIAEIEGGIKKETSIGCSVSRSICSICGEEIGSAGCTHERGREYAGKLCYAEHLGALDAYEWSFVAVPAQKKAGVIKYFEEKTLPYNGVLSGGEDEPLMKRYEYLEKEAALGRKYMEKLRGEVLRLSLLSDGELYKVLEGAVLKMDDEELEALRCSLEGKLIEKFPAATQLPGRCETVRFDGGEYLI